MQTLPSLSSQPAIHQRIFVIWGRVSHHGRPTASAGDMTLRNEDGNYVPGVVLDFDYWALLPRH